MKNILNFNGGLDWRALVIGILIGMLLLLASGQESSSRYMGRYIPVSGGNADVVFITDVYTGHTWRMDRDTTVDYGTPGVDQIPQSQQEN